MKPFAKILTALSALAFSGAATSTQAMGFESPSGNITCYIDTFGPLPFDETPMVCLIFEADWDMPADVIEEYPDCDLDRTRMIMLPPNGAVQTNWQCHGDIFWPIPLGALSYGSQWSVLGFDCFVQTSGVRCENAVGHSMTLSRGSLEVN